MQLERREQRRLESQATPASRGNARVAAMQRKWPEGDGPAQRQPQQTFRRHSPNPNQKNTVPTRGTSRRTGSREGSSIISPAATMGITAVKILVRKMQTDTEKIKTGRHERGHVPHARQLKALPAARAGGSSRSPPFICRGPNHPPSPQDDLIWRWGS